MILNFSRMCYGSNFYCFLPLGEAMAPFGPCLNMPLIRQSFQSPLFCEAIKSKNPFPTLLTSQTGDVEGTFRGC